MKHIILLLLLLYFFFLTFPLVAQETGVLYLTKVNGKFYGKGTFIFSNGNKGVGEFRDNKPWNITTYDKDGNYKWKYVKGFRQ